MTPLSHLTSRIAPLAALPLLLAACSQQGPADPPAPSPAARVTGEAVSCIPLAQFRETRVRNDWTIDFIGSGNRAWRNTLTGRCSGLRVNNAITYETSLNQLCNSDIVYVLDTTGGGARRGAACGLGRFVPVELAK